MPKFVMKRSGEYEEVCFDKISQRIEKLCFGLNMDYININDITRYVRDGITDNITTEDIDELSAGIMSSHVSIHPDYGVLAGRVVSSNLQKKNNRSFSETIDILYNYHENGHNLGLISESVHKFVMFNAEELDYAIDDRRDYDFDYFAMKTLERSYLLRVHGEIVERPQYMFMRVACGIHYIEDPNLELNKEAVKNAIETYEMMSKKNFIMATPTLFNSGTRNAQMSSCFLVDIKADSIDGIYSSLRDCAIISKYAGGIGINVHKIRASGTYIAGTNGYSNGLVPMLGVFNKTAEYVDQGGGKRKGAISIYLEPWHADIENFLLLKRNSGKEEVRARSLFYALWIPDLFMRRVEEPDGKWTLFCPKEAPGLDDVWGEDFDRLYEKYEKEGRGKTIDAQYLWKQIINSQRETGVPYILYKDACNSKSNHQHLGTIKSSNLCTEIVQYTCPDEIAVCNLASINLNSIFVKKEKRVDFQKLMDITRVVVRNLNCVIDKNFYPVPEAKKSNQRHRPIGIGVQGLADLFAQMEYPFESKEAINLNKCIFEHMYFAAVSESCELAIKYGGPYESFRGSPMSKGIFQFDMWGVSPSKNLMLPWDELKEKVVKYGVRNSLLIAPMPTATTSQILGNSECFDPYKGALISRQTNAGEFTILNQYFVEKMIELGLWNKRISYKDIDANGGSISSFDFIPENIREVYKSVWEMKQKSLVDMAVSRAPFIDQSQSMSLYFSDTSYAKLTSAHFYIWRQGLKTGSYYMRQSQKVNAIQFTVQDELNRNGKKNQVCNDDICTSCSS